jgi:hypothetical protein
MRIGDLLNYRGHAVILLGLDPMSVPDRRASVRDVETGEAFDVAFDELEACEGLPPTA